MDITLEKIELVRDRTGVTYKEAKEALEASGGDVVDAIIALEDKVDMTTGKKTVRAREKDLMEKIKGIIHKGNVSRIVVSREGETILNLPLTAGIIGALIAPWAFVAGVAASFGFRCDITFLKEDGSVVDINEKTGDLYNTAKEKGGAIYEDLKDKGSDIYADIKEKAPDVYADLKEKSGEALDKVKEVAAKATKKVRKSADEFDFDDFKDDIAEEAKEAAEDIKETAKDVKDAVAEKISDVKDAAAEKAEDVRETVEETAKDVKNKANKKAEGKDKING